MTKANVTDADRAAAQTYFEALGQQHSTLLEGKADGHIIVQTLANHRTQSTAALQAENEKLRGLVLVLDDCVDALLDGPDEEDKAWTKKKWRKVMDRFAALSDGEGRT